MHAIKDPSTNIQSALLTAVDTCTHVDTYMYPLGTYFLCSCWCHIFPRENQFLYHKWTPILWAVDVPNPHNTEQITVNIEIVEANWIYHFLLLKVFQQESVPPCTPTSVPHCFVNLKVFTTGYSFVLEQGSSCSQKITSIQCNGYGILFAGN